MTSGPKAEVLPEIVASRSPAIDSHETGALTDEIKQGAVRAASAVMCTTVLNPETGTANGDAANAQLPLGFLRHHV
ncbi:hypothetical protein BH23PAT1_BH23PAT1_2190 [soil metagenome]